MVELSDADLVKRVRGKRTQIEFAEALGVAQSMVSDWERGAHAPSADVWIKMARVTDGRFNQSCWERAGLNKAEREILLEALRIEAEPRSQLSRDFLKAKEAFSQSFPEPTAEDLVVDPTPEEDKVKSLEDWVKRYGPLQKPDFEGAKARVREMLDEWVRGGKLSPATREEWVREWGLPPGELVAGEPKPLAPAKKAKRERTRKK